MYTATVQTTTTRQLIEAYLREQVILAGHAFRYATDEAKPAARQQYAEVLAAFNHLVLGEFTNFAAESSCPAEPHG